jgi:hypothetical protein
MSDLSSLSSSFKTPLAPAHEADTSAVDDKRLDEVPLWRCGLLLILAAIIVISYWLNPPVYVPAQAGVILALPDAFANFHGLSASMTPAEIGGLPPDTGFARKDYFDSAGDDVTCTIVLSGSGQNSIHRPEACLTGQGWSLVKQENIPIQLKSGHLLVVRSLSLERDEVTPEHLHHTLHHYFMYWFVGDHVTTPSHFTRVFLSSWDRVVHNRAHRWAYVIAASDVPDGAKGDAQTRAMLLNFIRDIVPTFQKSEMPADASPSP